MSEDLVTIEITDGVADVRLNRPDKYNALSSDMFKAIIDAGERLADSKEVRAVVLSGNGRGFCAGLDMESMAGLAGTARVVMAVLTVCSNAMIALRTMRRDQHTSGSACLCRSSVLSMVSLMAAVRRLPSALTYVLRHQMPNCRSWRSSGGSFRI